MDEALLAQLDRDDEARRIGRSAVLRKAVEAYLRQRQAAAIADGYDRGYRDAPGLEPSFAGWDEEGVWPAK